MAITKVGSDVAVTVTADANNDITLPSGLQENDVVIVAAVSDADLSADGIQTSGYTVMFKPATASPGHEFSYKRMGATPDTVVNFTAAANDTFVVIQAWRGVNTTTALDNGDSSSASGGSGMPNPPAYTTVSADALRIVVGFMDDDLPTSIAAPSPYTNLVTRGVNTNSTVMMASYVDASPDSENPDAFTGGTPNTDQWFSYHIALKPAGGDTTLSPDRFDESDTFHAHTLTSVYTLSPDRFDEGDTFHDATISLALTLTPDRYDDPDTFHDAAITLGAITLSPDRHDDADGFHGPTITNEMPLTQTSRFDDGDTFHAATVSLELSLTPDRYDDPDTFHAHEVTVIGGDTTLSPERYDDPDVFHTAVISGELSLAQSSRFDDADTFHAHTVTGELTLTPDRYDNTPTFHAHAISQIVPSFHCVGNELRVLANPIVGTWNVTVLCTDDMGRQKQKVFAITLT